MRIRRVAIALVACSFALAAAACGGSSTASSGPTSAAPSFKGVVRTQPIQVGDVTLPEETPGSAAGTRFPFKAKPGELLVAYFGYTSCPDVCPTTLANLNAARKKVGADAGRVDLAMATVDPERDTATVLDGYLRHFADRYHVLRTTDPAQLKAAEDVFGTSSSVAKTQDGKVEVTHSGTAFVVDEHGTVLVEWPFGITPDDMANDLRVALAKVGAATTTGSTP